MTSKQEDVARPKEIDNSTLLEIDPITNLYVPNRNMKISNNDGIGDYRKVNSVTWGAFCEFYSF